MLIRWTRCLAPSLLALALTACSGLAPLSSAASPTAIPSPSATPAPAETPILAPAAAPEAVADAPAEPPSEWPTCWEMLSDPELKAAALDLWADGRLDELITLLDDWRADQTVADEAADVCLGRVYLADGNISAGVGLLRAWASKEGPLQAQVLALLMDAYEGADEWQSAAQAGQMLLALDPPAATMVAWRTERALVQAGEETTALALLSDLDVSALPGGTRAEILEERARLAREANEWELSLASLDEILSYAVLPGYRAQIKVERARTLVSISEYDEAIALLNEVLDTQASGISGQLALQLMQEVFEQTELETAEVPLVVQARVLVYADQYEDALETVNKALKVKGVDKAEAYAIKGLAYAGLAEPRSAVTEYDKSISLYLQRKLDDQGKERVAEVWFAKAEAVAANNGDPAKVYTLFVSRYPQHDRAPEALMLAAQASAEDSPSGAAELYARVVRDYPTSWYAPEAAVQAGLVLYADEQLPKAIAAWETAQDRLAAQSEASSVTSSDLARLRVWLGIARNANGDLLGAKDDWQAAVALDGNGYWGLRAADLLDARSLTLPLSSRVIDEAPTADWDAIAAWVAEWAGEPLALEDAPLVQAGLWLWRMGWEEEATDLLEGLSDQHDDDGQLLLLIAREAENEGIWYMSTVAADRLRLAGQAAAATQAPDDLWLVSYPLVYEELVEESAELYGLDSLLYLALIRQESRFYARATSWVGARGLAQVMPSTGEWIAESVGQTFHEEMLYRPYLSIAFGAWYLNYGLSFQERHWPVALVVYNAGPGNMALWSEGEEVADYDLFLERLPSAETSSYLMGVYRQYRIYERLYR